MEDICDRSQEDSMSFPNYKYLLGFIKVKDGWEDRGKIGVFNDILGSTCVMNCHRCQNRVRIGRDETGTFNYCARCLVKIRDRE